MKQPEEWQMPSEGEAIGRLTQTTFERIDGKSSCECECSVSANIMAHEKGRVRIEAGVCVRLWQF